MPPKKAGRPRRVPESQPSPELEKPAATSALSAAPKNKRGRPAKATEDEPPAKRGRVADDAEEPENPPKPRGRPKKAEAAAPTPAVESVAKKRGRPAKAAAPAVPKAEIAAPKARGRPRKTDAPAVPEVEQEPPQPRGRPPKGGETTKIARDDVAAAEQLEDELLDTAEAVTEGKKSKPKSPVSNKRKVGHGEAPKDKAKSGRKEAANGELGETSSVKRYWLMKAEQEDREETLKSGRLFNAKFTIDDLQAKTVPEPWDGVRNPVAAKNMRAMKKGDLAFFYASGGKAGRKPGITGIVEVVTEHEPDQSAFDEDSYGYVEKESDRGRWCVVHVEFRKKLSQPVHLKELQRYSEGSGVLSDMQVLRLSRLSVSGVSEKEWDFIVNNLIEGYEA